MKKLNSYTLFTSTLLLLSIGLFSACSNSVSDDHEEHEPVGIVIYSNSVLQLTQAADQTISGSLSVDSAATADFTISFLDEEGDEFTPEPDEHSTNISILSGTNNVSLTNGNDSFSFSLTGVNPGEATFSITLLHVGEEEFVSLALPIEINSGS